MKTNSRTILIVVIFILLFIVISLPSLDSNSISYQNNVLYQDVNSKFTNNEDKLKMVIDKENNVEMLDVYYAIGRLTDIDIFKYPFMALKDPKGNGYIGVLTGIKSYGSNIDGKAMFLVSREALNQLKRSDLEKSIRAINGLAKHFNQNIEYANGYDYLEVMKIIDRK